MSAPAACETERTAEWSHVGTCADCGDVGVWLTKPGGCCSACLHQSYEDGGHPCPECVAVQAEHMGDVARMR